jgi:hypothetical protein
MKEDEKDKKPVNALPTAEFYHQAISSSTRQNS